MAKIFTIFLPAILILIGCLPVTGVVFWYKNKLRNARRSPLTREMLRPPGHSLRKKLEELDFDIDSYLVITLMIPTLAIICHIGQSYFAGEPETVERTIVTVRDAVEKRSRRTK